MNACDEMFESLLRANGDLAGVFEFDGETSYFYLFENDERDQKVVGAIHILSGPPDFDQSDITIRWSEEEDLVGLFIKGRLWAAFDEDRRKHGGNYQPGEHPVLPEEVMRAFKY